MKKTMQNLKNLESKVEGLALLMAELGIKSANINIEKVKSFVSVNLKTCSEDWDNEYIYLFNEDTDKDNYELENDVKCDEDVDLLQNEMEKDEIKKPENSKEPNKEITQSSSENIDTDNNSNSYESAQNKDNEDGIKEKSVDEKKLNAENTVDEEIIEDSHVSNIEDEQCADMLNEDLGCEEEVCPGQVGFGFEESEEDCFVPYEDDEYEDIDASKLQELEAIMAQNDYSEDESIYENDSIEDAYEEENINPMKQPTQSTAEDDGKIICSVIHDSKGNSTVKDLSKEENMVYPPNSNGNFKSNRGDESKGSSRKEYEEESCNKTNKTCNESNEVKKRKKGIIDFKEEDDFQKLYLKEVFKNM